MSDGLNQIRAMRITEIMTDFRDILRFMTSIRANPSASDYNEEVYVMLRRNIAQGQALLSEPFEEKPTSRGDDEQDRDNLRRIIADAAYRRFKAQKLYLYSRAALRAINQRQAALQGRQPTARDMPALQAINASFRQELNGITDAAVEQALRRKDMDAGMWMAEDPSLARLQQMAAANGGGSGGRSRGGN